MSVICENDGDDQRSYLDNIRISTLTEMSRTRVGSI